MKKFKINSIWFRVTVEIPVQIGSLSCKLISVVSQSGPGEGVDIDIEDIEDIEFDGIEVSDWKKLKEFYTSMGIDISKVLDEKCYEIMTQDLAQEIINSQVLYKI